MDPPVRLYGHDNDDDDIFYAINRIYDRNKFSLQKHTAYDQSFIHE